MTLEDFKQNFNNQITDELALFFEINDELGFENYSQGFGLYEDDKSGISTWSEDEAFLDQLMPFAQANGSGSMYVLWNNEAGKSLNELPVIVFGDEGGQHVIAKNIFEFMQLLTFDNEISVDHEEAYFYKDEEDYEESENLQEYIDWLKENFHLDPIQETESIIKNAQEKYKAAFDQWVAHFCPEAYN